MTVRASTINRVRQRLHHAWQWLNRSPATQSLEDIRYTRLLSTMILALIPLTIVIGGLIPLLTASETPARSTTFTIAFVVVFVLIFIYSLNRAGYYWIAARLIITIFILIPYVGVVRGNNPDNINEALIEVLSTSVLLTGILIRRRRTIVLTGAVAGIEMLLLPVFVSGIDVGQVQASLLVVLVTTALTLLYDWHRVQLESDRHWALQTALRRTEDTNQELLKAIELAKEATRQKSETDDQQNTLIAGLRAVIAITDELMTAPDTDTLYRRAVELAREKLGVERCAIFLDDDDNLMRGTYGTDMAGNTTDEHAGTIPKSNGLLDRFSTLAPQEQQWFVRDRDQTYWKSGHFHNVGIGWNAISRIQSGNRGIGVFFNDAAITHAPLDPIKQEVVALFCSMLGKIIERERLEGALRTSEERYRRLFDQIDDAIVIHDLEGNILDVNEATCQHLGYSRDELLRMKTHQIDAPELAAGFAGRLRQQITDGKLSHIQGVHVTSAGRLIDMDINSIVIAYNRQPAVLAVCRDISEQKRIERDLRDLVQLKTEFLSTAAHELRTPLASLVGFSELLLTREIAADRAKHFMQIIHEQSINLRRIIDSLLDISRLESKQALALNVQRFNMLELITQTQAYFSEVLPKYRFHIDGSDAPPSIMGDPFRLGQVFQNLLSNAIKYSPNGGEIIIRTQVISDFLQVSIQDHGIGMTPQQQAHLFERFYRADASNTTISGTGLGLAICKLIVELHGGQIWVESEYELGTTIYFTLPLTADLAFEISRA